MINQCRSCIVEGEYYLLRGKFFRYMYPVGVLIVKRNKSELKFQLFGGDLFGLNKTLVQNWAESRFSAITLIRIKNNV